MGNVAESAEIRRPEIYIFRLECMIMRKNEYHKQKKGLPSLARATRRMLCFGLPPIYAAVLGILISVGRATPMTEANALYHIEMLEYPLAALVLLTFGALLSELVARER